MKLTLSAVALILLATPAAAQTAPAAAASLPNSFDSPRSAAVAPQSQTPSAADPAETARAETALKGFIAAAQAGAIDYSVMSDDLAEKVREQEAAVTPLIQSFGAIQAVEAHGQENGAQLFRVTFEKAVTQWIIGLGPDDKIVALLFRPAPAAGEDQ